MAYKAFKVDQALTIVVRITSYPVTGVEVAFPAPAMKYLEDHGLGVNYLLESIRNSPYSELLRAAEREVKLRLPNVRDPERPDETEEFRRRNADGSLNRPGPLILEAFLRTYKEEQGAVREFTFKGLVMDFFEATEAEANRALYESRGSKNKHAGTPFYTSFRAALNKAMQVLEVQGWIVRRPTTKGSKIQRTTYSLMPSGWEDIADLPLRED